MRLLPTIAALSLGLAGAAHAEPIAGDGPGCKDKTVAAGLIGLTDTDPPYIAI